MDFRSISDAYREQNSIGSSCIAPLRTYNTWFQNKINTSEGGLQTAWKIAHVASGIFAYLILGLPALVGIILNLKDTRLSAIRHGVPDATEELCKTMRLLLRTTMDAEERISQHGVVDTAQKMIFKFQIQNNNLEDHIDAMQTSIRDISRESGRAPTGFRIQKLNNDFTITIPLPDSISPE